jgi:hypothetical protein
VKSDGGLPVESSFRHLLLLYKKRSKRIKFHPPYLSNFRGSLHSKSGSILRDRQQAALSSHVRELRIAYDKSQSGAVAAITLSAWRWSVVKYMSLMIFAI